MNKNTEGPSGPDPCWWTFLHFRTNRYQPCQEHVHHTHRNSEIRSSNWLEMGERLRIWPMNSNQLRQRPRAGSNRPIGTREKSAEGLSTPSSTPPLAAQQTSEIGCQNCTIIVEKDRHSGRICPVSSLRPASRPTEIADRVLCEQSASDPVGKGAR
jgi:hypothetical protein